MAMAALVGRQCFRGEGGVLRLVCIGQQSLLGGVADGSSDRFWRLDATLVSTLLLIYHSVHIHTSIYQRLCDVVGRRAHVDDDRDRDEAF